MLRIRPFAPGDVGQVMVLVRDALMENYPPSLYHDLYQWWKEGFLIAENTGKILGFIACVVSAPAQARVLMLAVDEPHRRRGIGSLLLDEFARECAKRGLRSIELEVRQSNLEAIKFYRRHGFEIVYSIEKFYTDGENGYKMVKHIGAS